MVPAAQLGPSLRRLLRQSFTIVFTFYVGGRFHFSDSVALTMRIGHPIDFSLGVSFFL